MYPPFGGLGPYGAYGSLGQYGALVAHGSLSLTETSPPQSFTEPLSLADVIGYLRLPDSVASDVAISNELAGHITAARQTAEAHQGRDLVCKQWDLSHDYWPSYRVELRDPLVSVDLAQYRDSDGNYTVMSEGADYVVDFSKHPAVVAPLFNHPWPTFTPWPSSAILIRFTSGLDTESAWWATSGGIVKIGMQLLIKAWFNKEELDDKRMAAITGLLSYGAVPRA
jgi:uncharacterized phiE125 gp8 family phage protein